MSKKRSFSQRREEDRHDKAAPVQHKQRPTTKEKTKVQLTLIPQAEWHALELADLPGGVAAHITNLPLLDKLSEHANGLLDAENKAYAAHTASQSSSRFASTIMAAGTLEDKVSALTLQIQESPLHNLKAMENLLGLASKRNRDQALMAAVAIKDLLSQGSVLPDRKLRQFSKQPGLLGVLSKGKVVWAPGKSLPAGLTNQHLLAWAFEDWLKRQYFEYLKTLESWCSDEVSYARSRAVTYIWELLKDKPEQEENLLRLLVNKLGDKDRKIASRTSHLLLQLQTTHPVMKRIIINAIENECLFRPGQTMHAKYFSIVTLNQTVLGKADQEVASELLRIYFSTFVQLLKPLDAGQLNGKVHDRKQGGGGHAGKQAAKKAKERAKAAEQAEMSEAEVREKMTAQVLTGVNRAFPYADTDSMGFSEQIDTIFRVTHSSNFNTSIQALMLLQKLTSRKHDGVDRFYRTLYESLMDPRLITSSKQIMYLNLLYRSLKSDVSIKRVQAFVKRLLQIIHCHDVPFVCGVIYLVRELEITFPGIRSMLNEPETALDDGEEHFADVPEDGETSKPMIKEGTDASNAYDPRKREPEHSNADKSGLWELLPMLAHFHPSVSLFAECLLKGRQMPPKPDPTTHSVMHFLDRFVYRNAKTKQSTSKGSSIMQPQIGSAAADMFLKPSVASKAQGPVNIESFRNRRIEDIPADQVFFHKYFTQATKSKTPIKKKPAKTDDTGSGDDGESEEDEIWKALVDSRPEVDGPDEDDDDLSMDDLDSAFAESDDEAAGEDADDDINMDAGVEIADFPEDEEEEGSAGASDDEDGFEFDDDEDALLDDDADVPSDVELDARAEDVADATGQDSSKRSKRRKLKNLPTFASAEDYAKLLADEPDDY